MNTRSEQDVNIGWVKSEIDETLKLARQALEVYVENPSDDAQLRFLTTHLHQVVGTLQIVELYGAALLCEETELLVNDLIEDKISQKDDAYEVIMRAILQLPTYLDHIQQGFKDNPITLLPLLNDLRTTRGQSLLSEHAFFSPNLNVFPDNTNTSTKTENLPAFAKKLRPLYLTGLVGLFRNNDVQKNLKLLSTVIRKLEESVDSDNARQLLWISGGVIEGLYNQGLEANVSLKSLLGQVDRCIKKMIDGGEDALKDDIPKELIKNLLYYVAQTTTPGSRVNELQQAFNLSSLLPDANDKSQSGDALNFGTDVIKNVSAAIKEDMLSIKDSLDLFVRSEEKSVSDLEPLCEKLRSVADTLGLLGMGKLRKLIKEQEQVVSEAISSNGELDDSVIMSIASALLFVESSINDLRLINSEEDDDDGEINKLLPDSEYNQLVDLTITEAKSVLAKIKDAFIGFAADTSKKELLENIPNLINEVKGAFIIVSFGRAADLINSCGIYIKQELIDSSKVPEQDDLDALADVISGIEYFLENFTIDSTGARKSLDIAQESLIKLGFPPENLKQSGDISSEPAEEPAQETTSDSTSETTPEATAEPEETEPQETLGVHIPEDEQSSNAAFDIAFEDEDTSTTNIAKTPDDDALELSISEGGDGLDDEISEPEAEIELSLNNLPDETPTLEDTPAEEISLENTSTDLNEPDETQVEEIADSDAESSFIEEEDDDEIDPEILEIFLEEAEEELASIGEQLVNWEANLSDDNALTSLRRSFHTLKGSGRIVGAIDIGEFAWAIESLLNKVIETTVTAGPELFTILHQSKDVLPELIGQIKDKGAPSDAILQIAENARKLTNGEAISLDDATDTATTGNKYTIDQATSKGPTLDPVLVEIFTNETKSHLTAIRHYIENCQNDGLPCKVNNDLIRALHTLHGSAHMAGVNDIAELSDQLEKYAKLILENETEISQDVMNLLENSVVAIETMINGLTDGITDLENKDSLIEQTSALYEAEMSVHKNRLGGSDTTTDITPAMGIDDELINIFLKEADEILEQTTGILADWLLASDNNELIDALRRHIHTLKGGAKIANLPTIAEVCSALQKILTQLLEQQITLSEHFPTTVESAHKWLTESFALEQAREKPSQTHVLAKVELMQQMERLSSGYTDTEIQVEEISLEIGSDNILGTDEELVNIFVIEAQEILAQVNDNLPLWSNDLDNSTHVEELQRAMHMLMGGARMAKINTIGNVAHQAESLLTKVSSAQIKAKENIISGIQSAHDWIVAEVEMTKTGQSQGENNDLINQLLALENQNSDIEIQAPVVDEIVLSDSLDDSLTETDGLTLDDDSGLSITLEEDGADESITLSAPDEDLDVSGINLDTAWTADETDEEDYDEDLADIFLEEATEILHSMDELLDQWSKDPNNMDTIGEVLRALHTLKGGARMASIGPIGDISHSIETVLEKITGGHLKATPQLVEIVQTSYDWLNQALETIQNGEPLATPQNLIDEIEISVGLKQATAKPETPAAEVATHKIATPAEVSTHKIATPTEVSDEPAKRPAKPSLVPDTAEEQSDRLSAVFSTDESDSEQAPTDFDMAAFKADEEQSATAKQKQTKTSDDQIRVPAKLLNNLVNYAGEVSIYRSRVDQQLGSIGYNLTEFDQTIARIGEQLRKFEIEAEAQILFRYETNVDEESEDFDPLELDRFSNMQQLSRSLVESMGDLKSIKALLENYMRESEILLLQQSRVTSELQDGLIRTRLVPFSNAVPRLRRIIRQTAKELGKSVDFKVSGAEGEMDRSVLDRVVPALEHMLRNAVDHGIEIPKKRKAAKKNETGRILLQFKQVGPKIVIQIQDDGAGMDLKAIRDKAVERDLMTKDSDLSDNEIMQFVLESGFSTATKVTQISGRGVGMDVVNTEIKQVAGTLHIDTKADKGSIFTIQLPLTVSANQALIIETGEDNYAIPLSSVDGVIRVSDKELTKLFAEDKPTYKYGGRSYGFFHLGSILGVSNPLEPVAGEKIPLILARAGDHNVALLVERIVGRQEIVIKSVGPQISTVNGISGATIMGDGTIALILDISSLIREGYAHIAKIQIEKARLESEKVVVSDKPTIMVVDDSITVRKVTERLLKRHDMICVTAKDGIDALDVLQETVPDVMLLDIEMPRMDGFELATAIRNDDRLKNIPIIMITSRTGDKHRNRATKIGVNAYLGKPFQETELLENIESLLNSSE